MGKEKPLNPDAGRTQVRRRASEKEPGLVPPILDNLELRLKHNRETPDFGVLNSWFLTEDWMRAIKKADRVGLPFNEVWE